MKKFLIATILLFTVTACATNPSRIEPHYVSPLVYNDWDCWKIEKTAQERAKRGSDLYSELLDRAESDDLKVAAGMAVFWPALLLTNGDGDEAEEFKIIKGEYRALRIAGEEKSCNMGAAPYWAD